MKSILLIGLGRFGYNVADKLNELGHEIMAVDRNEERVENILPIVTNAQIGDSSNPDFLRTLGVGNFDVCIVAIAHDFQSSIETTTLLKDMGAKLVVARAESDVQQRILLRNGADQVVFPEAQMARWTAIRYSSDHILDYIPLDNQYSFFEVKIPTRWVGKTIGALDIRRTNGINIMALKRNGRLDMNISAATVLPDDCTMLVLGKTNELLRSFGN
ncbi:MAG: TrkA family potassium uptake protein [Coriobacteriaceae bacterium]|nr:TrkA family potassium uptake protein [Coriobacteriaceae bacterium]